MLKCLSILIDLSAYFIGTYKTQTGGRNSSVGSMLGSLFCAWCTIVSSIFFWASGRPRGDLLLEGDMAPFPPKSFGWAYKPRSGLRTHAFHRTDSKHPDIHVLDRWMQQQKHTHHAPSTKSECDYLYSWIEKRSHTQKSHPKWWTPEMQLGTQKKR